MYDEAKAKIESWLKADGADDGLIKKIAVIFIQKRWLTGFKMMG